MVLGEEKNHTLHIVWINPLFRMVPRLQSIRPFPRPWEERGETLGTMVVGRSLKIRSLLTGSQSVSFMSL